MTLEKHSEIELRRQRIRRIKKLLRPLPRRTNLHRYPILKWFANTARKRSYIWSFKRANVVRALYLGWIIALIPIYGSQMAIAFILSLVFRANCLIAMALQWITNPLTIGPILYGQYLLGKWVIESFTGENRSIGSELMQKLQDEGFWPMIKSVADWGTVWHLASSIFLGGFIIAMAGAVISHVVYLVYRRRFEKTRPIPVSRNVK